MKKSLILKNFRIALAAAAFAVLAAALAACGVFRVPLQSIVFADEYLNIYVGQEITINYKLNPLTTTDGFTLTSNNPSVATVDKSGHVKGVSEGQTKFRAASEDGKVTATIDVYVQYDSLRDATLTATKNRVQYYDGIASSTPAGVEMLITVNEPNDYTNGDYIYEWFVYNDNENGNNYELSKAEIAAMVTAGETDKFRKWTAFDSYSETFAIRKIRGEAISMFARVTENGGYAPKTVYTNLVTFGVYDEMKGVTITVPENSGLALLSDGNYIAQVGKPVILELTWEKNCNAAPDITWLWSEKFSAAGSFTSAAEVPGQKSRRLWFTPTSLDGQYQISARADNANGMNVVTFVTRKADVSDVVLSAAAPDGTALDSSRLYQQTSAVYPVTFTVNWNKSDAGADKAVEWYVNNVRQETEDLTFTLEPTSEVKNYDVFARVFYDDRLGEKVFAQSETVTVYVTERFDAINSAAISVENPDMLVQKIGGANAQSFAVHLNVLPAESVNPKASAVWYNNGRLMENVTCSSSGFITFTPSPGENNVYAVIDNVKTNTLTVFAVTQTEAQTRESYMENTYVWNGENKNAWLSYADEVIAAIQYQLLTHTKTAEFFIPYATNFPDGTTLTAAINRALYSFELGAGLMGFNYNETPSGSGKILTVTLADEYMNKPEGPTKPFASKDGGSVPQALSYFVNIDGVPYIDDENDRELFIESAPLYPVAVTNSNMLYLAVQSGYRPQFNGDENGDALQALYDDAVKVAKTIISDGMSDFEKVLAIYDWLIYCVEYDYKTADYDDSTWYIENCFFLEGVFNTVNRLAVCDGKSKAFVLLCAMENITSVRVIGTASSSVGNRGNHAWNKVLLDADPYDDDAVKRWYAVDTTWGDRMITTGGGKGSEFLLHSYFLISDGELSQTHTELTYTIPPSEFVYKVDYPAAESSVAALYFKTSTFDDTAYDFYIETAAELKSFLSFFKTQTAGGFSPFVEIIFVGTENNFQSAAFLAGVSVDSVFIVDSVGGSSVYLFRIKV
ncbi:MAG: Ig-like domain-containing protein [Clostridiales bacterium]|jgi:hypothetical protein|nr:Ig-like domain-containing protein [Clostridiales bacterium]